jgi:hypothetical protein
MKIKSLLVVLFILLVATVNVFALTTVPLDCSNALPNGNENATVTIELLPGTCSGDDGIKITVAPNQSILIPTETEHEIQNYGIQRFGFNYNGNSELLDITSYEDDGITVEPNWDLRTSQNVSEFGVFVELLQGTGKHRHDPYILSICKTGTDLTEADFNVENELGNNFVAHIADFYFNETFYETDSAYFSECPTAPDNPYTIYGTVSGDVKEGVTLTIYHLSCGELQPYAEVTTDAFGNYAIGGFQTGRYLVGPDPDDAGYSFSSSYWVDIPQEPIQSFDFTATED